MLSSLIKDCRNSFGIGKFYHFYPIIFVYFFANLSLDLQW